MSNDDEDNVVPLKRKGLRNQGGRKHRVEGEHGKIRLTDKQEQFCIYRADGFGKTQAYAKAYPTDQHPGQNGNNLEQKEHIQKRIGQLREERAWAAKLVDPQESLIRWNEIYLDCTSKGDLKNAMEAQKQIDKINGAEASVVRQQLEVKGLFRGETEEEWRDNSTRLLNILSMTPPKPINRE